MKIRLLFATCLIGMSLTFVGCADKKETLPNSSTETSVVMASETKQPTEKVDSPKPQSAADAVSQLTTAILHGENETVRSLLTPQARKKVEERGTPFALTASHTASFTIDQTTALGEIGAYVYMTLTDQNEKGEKESAEIIWIVAKSEEGWRVGAAAVAVYAGQEKTIINFEDPEAAQTAIATAANREIQQQVR